MGGTDADAHVAFSELPVQAGFDCRIPATVDLTAFKARVDGWCSEEGVSWELVAGSADRALENPSSPTDGEAWNRFSRAVAATGIGLHPPMIYPAATDSRWIRLTLGVPCFGKSTHCEIGSMRVCCPPYVTSQMRHGTSTP